MPHLSEFTFPKSHENNERGFNLFSTKDLVAASGSLLACSDSTSAAQLSWIKAAELAMGKQRFSHSGEHWLLRDPPNVFQQRAQAEPAGGTGRNRLPALLLPTAHSQPHRSPPSLAETVLPDPSTAPHFCFALFKRNKATQK